MWILPLYFLLFCQALYSLSISTLEANKIGEKIWKNECAGTIEGLTSWNKGEQFASLGIGHFIWYPAGKKGDFQETFPDLLKFLQQEGTTLPSWLTVGSECPWNSREEFHEAIESPKMKSLRQFLFCTKQLQAIFMAKRLEQFLSVFLNKEKIATLLANSNGIYALLDYLNFKGSGTSPKETYKGQGWGLLQVLQLMPTSSIEDFVESAKFVLKRRVENSPPERNEKQWLKGWFNRLETYTQGNS